MRPAGDPDDARLPVLDPGRLLGQLDALRAELELLVREACDGLTAATRRGDEWAYRGWQAVLGSRLESLDGHDDLARVARDRLGWLREQRLI